MSYRNSTVFHIITMPCVLGSNPWNSACWSWHWWKKCRICLFYHGCCLSTFCSNRRMAMLKDFETNCNDDWRLWNGTSFDYNWPEQISVLEQFGDTDYDWTTFSWNFRSIHIPNCYCWVNWDNPKTLAIWIYAVNKWDGIALRVVWAKLSLKLGVVPFISLI